MCFAWSLGRPGLLWGVRPSSSAIAPVEETEIRGDPDAPWTRGGHSANPPVPSGDRPRASTPSPFATATRSHTVQRTSHQQPHPGKHSCRDPNDTIE